MKKKIAPKKKSNVLEVRLTDSEKISFQDAAELAGIPLSAWVRERLRRDARRELEDAAWPIKFLEQGR